MKKKNILYTIFVLFFLLSYFSINGKAVIIEDNLPLTADDGTEVLIIKADEQFYNLSCSHKDQVLFEFPIRLGFYHNPKLDYNFELIKLHEYKNVITYRFNASFTFGEDIMIHTLIWLSKEKDGYCGGLDYAPLPLQIEPTTEGDKQFYEYTKDAFIDIINSELAEYSKSLDCYVEFEELNIAPYIDYISGHDEEIGNPLRKKYDEAISKRNEYDVSWVFENQILLMRYSSPVWQIDYKQEGWERDRKKLPLKGKLPQNKRELKVYTKWILKVYEVKKTLDVYDEPLKYKLEKDGLRVSSSGFDKKWNTADDQTYLNKYSEIDVLLDANCSGLL